MIASEVAHSAVYMPFLAIETISLQQVTEFSTESPGDGIHVTAASSDKPMQRLSNYLHLGYPKKSR
jgi:hypothetical protein